MDAMPYVDDEVEVGEEDVTTPTTEDFPLEGEDLEFDVTAGDIVFGDGEAEELYDEDALEQWIEKTLLTRAGAYEIYKLNPEMDELDDDDEDEEEGDKEETYDDIPDGGDDDEDEEEDEETEALGLYGTELYDVFYDTDTSRDFKYGEIQRIIEEALLQHPEIYDVSDFSFGQKKRKLKIDFLVTTIYGVMRQGVTL